MTVLVYFILHDFVEVTNRCGILSKHITRTIMHCSVSEEEVATLVGKCPKLKLQTLPQELKGDLFCAAVAKHRPDVTSINLSSGKVSLTDVGLEKLATACRGITSINLSGLDKVTDAGLDTLGKLCNGLTEVDVTKCPQITERVVGLLVTCTDLQVSAIKSNFSVAELESLAFRLLALRGDKPELIDFAEMGLSERQS